jgi:hypothetical protein
MAARPSPTIEPKIGIWLRRAHLAIGVAGLLTFLWTGRFMLTHFPVVYRGHEEIRFLYRANHLYIMFASVLNLVLGMHGQLAPSSRWRRPLLVVSSLAILVAVPILIVAFYLEPPRSGAPRWTTLVGCVLVFGGGVLSLVATRSRPEL